jgi:hypothetical protein
VPSAEGVGATLLLFVGFPQFVNFAGRPVDQLTAVSSAPLFWHYDP